jgi:exosortase
LWAYWTTLLETAERWFEQPEYSHGYLVPLFSLYLLWRRRSKLSGAPLSPSWWGIAVLVAGIACRAGGVRYFYGYFDAVSLLICLAGMALVVGGRNMLRWSWPAILFLGFMVPLPYRLHIALSGQLQDIATNVSTYLLQTLGVPAVAEGRIILINDTKVGVVEACNGLGMLFTFLAIATAVAMLLKDGWVRKAFVIVSAAPIAVLANVIRITVTCVLYDASFDRAARVVFHDVAGVLMMPLAVIVIFIELYLFDRIVIERPKRSPLVPVMFSPTQMVSSSR